MISLEETLPTFYLLPRYFLRLGEGKGEEEGKGVYWGQHKILIFGSDNEGEPRRN